MVTYRIEILVAADAMVMRDTMVIISVSMSSTLAYILLTKMLPGEQIKWTK